MLLLPQNINEAAQLQQQACIELSHRQHFCSITELWLCAENEITSRLSHTFSTEMLLAAGHQNSYVPLTYRRQKTGADPGLILTLPSTLFLKSRSSFYRVYPHSFLFKWSNFPVPLVSLRRKRSRVFVLVMWEVSSCWKSLAEPISCRH